MIPENINALVGPEVVPTSQYDKYGNFKDKNTSPIRLRAEKAATGKILNEVKRKVRNTYSPLLPMVVSQTARVAILQMELNEAKSLLTSMVDDAAREMIREYAKNIW